MGGNFSQGNGVNANDQVTGYSAIDAAGVVQHAFLYSAGKMKDLGTLGSGTVSSGLAINASGQVAGYSWLDATNFHAFRYAGGMLQDLGTFGGTRSAGEGISTNGQVVGNSTTTADATQHAFLYNGGTMLDLNVLAITGWELAEASAINDKAQITGNGIHAGRLTSFARHRVQRQRPSVTWTRSAPTSSRTYSASAAAAAAPER